MTTIDPARVDELCDSINNATDPAAWLRAIYDLSYVLVLPTIERLAMLPKEQLERLSDHAATQHIQTHTTPEPGCVLCEIGAPTR